MYMYISLCLCPRVNNTITAELQTICKEYWQRLFNLEGDKFDLEHIQKIKAQEVIKPKFENSKKEILVSVFPFFFLYKYTYKYINTFDFLIIHIL